MDSEKIEKIATKLFMQIQSMLIRNKISDDVIKNKRRQT